MSRLDEDDLDYCTLNVRLAAKLKTHGFTYLSEVDVLSDEQILALPGIGQGALLQIRQQAAKLKIERGVTIH